MMGEPQTRQEAEDDGRQRRHDLHRRLDVFAQPRRHEVGGIDGASDAGHREHHGIEGGFQGTEHQGTRLSLASKSLLAEVDCHTYWGSG